jgi:uncharacterized Fe-S cluster-containing radical SAM superfamily protein
MVVVERSIRERVLSCRRNCVALDQLTGEKRYLIVPSFAGTGFEKQGVGINCPIFRSFEAVKPASNRIMRGQNFDMYSNTLFDYPNIIATRMHKPWQNFNFMTSVHVASCPLDCWYCYVDECLRLECQDCRYRGKASCKQLRSHVKRSMLTAKEIFDAFLRERHAKGIRKNVLRITGGEPFLVPELIRELLELFAEHRLLDSVFLWTETNLTPFIRDKVGRRAIDEYDRTSIDDLLKYENCWALHPCFHGSSNKSFKGQTGVRGNVDDLVEALRFLVEKGVDVYPSVSSNMCPNGELVDLFGKLSDVNINVPLRVALIETDLRYQPVQDRFDLDASLRKTVYDKWSNIHDWDSECFRKCGFHYAVVDREKVPLTGHIVLEGDPPLQRLLLADETVQPGNYVYLFKSCYRDLYRQELLSLLALPKGASVQLEYRDDLLHGSLQRVLTGDTVKAWKGNLHGVIIYMDKYDHELTRFVPLRRIELLEVFSESGITTLRFNVGEYVEARPEFCENLRESLGESNLPESSQMHQKWVFQSANLDDAIKEVRFGEVVANLLGDPEACREDWRESCFVRIDEPEEIKIGKISRVFKERYKKTSTEPVISSRGHEEQGFHLVNRRSYEIPIFLLNPHYTNDILGNEKIEIKSNSEKIAVFDNKAIDCAKYRRTGFRFNIVDVLWRKDFACLQIESTKKSMTVPSIQVKTKLTRRWGHFVAFLLGVLLGLALVIVPNVLTNVSQIYRLLSGIIGLAAISIAFFAYTDHWIGP